MPDRRDAHRDPSAGRGAEDPYANLPRRTRARKTIGDPGTPRLEVPTGQRRRLTEEERRAIRERRQVPVTPSGGAEKGAATTPAAPSDRTAGGERRVSRRDGSRAITLGALLFVTMIVIAAGAGGIFDGSEPRTPTPSAAVAELLASPVAPEIVVVSTPSPVTLPVDDERVVCLDPGHGGDDTGFARQAGGGLPFMAEADYSLAHALDLAGRLRAQGFTVVLTRRTPNAVNASGADVNGDGDSLLSQPRPNYNPEAEAERIARAGEIDEQQARINVCNAAGADLLVSMHVNGFDRPSPTARGYETWYTGVRPFGDRSQRFATLVFQALGEQFAAAGLETPAREVNDDDKVDVDANDPGFFDHMIMTGPEVPGIIQPSEMPGAIVESLFISDDGDARILASTEGHEAIVSAYEQAIQAYFEEFPG